MKKKTHISIFINAILILAVLLFTLDSLTSFEIKNQLIKFFAYLGIIFIPLLTLINNIKRLKVSKHKMASILFPSFVLISVFFIGPNKIIFSSRIWKTQRILYQNRKSSFKKVEFQMQDIGALGYNKRTVEVTYITTFFMIVNPVTKGINQKVEWIKVDK